MLDDLDRQIVGALHIAPRASWDDMAEVVSADASTVSRRFARLTQQKILRVVGEVDWRLFSTTLPVHVRIETHGVSPVAVVQQLNALSTVQHLALTYGTYPVFATVHAADETATARLLREIYDISGVSAVTTLPVLAFASKGSGWDPQLLSPEQRARCVELSQASGTAVGIIHEDDGLSVALEPLEKKALQLLQQDGRIASARLAKPLGIAASTAVRLVRKFIREGWFRPRVEVDGTYLGYDSPFVLRAKTSLGCAGDVIEVLAEHPSTRFVTQVAAEYDILCTGLARNRSHIAELINQEFGAVAGIRDLHTDLFLLEMKRYWMSRGDEQRLGAFNPPPLL